ncbi:iron ABC transporter permease [Shimia sp. R10_1]|uniref:FecCD family ABC transporter permease n=1 Tax=Shimia sp. R10_1 TaxID=2821095 RepID=UPI001ADA9021|nr:iron ABC transporter permease [Shimia sp. R10_1]MBO9475692.1 iron ABC transporter permease [Shimia sp. R10_1]
MTGPLVFALVFMVSGLLANLCFGAQNMAPADVFVALFSPNPDNYEHFVVQTQRMPRIWIAVYTGGVMAIGGAVLQSLSRNPMASPQILGINAGASLFVVVGVVLFGLSPHTAPGVQAGLALLGGLAGFVGCVLVARVTAESGDPRGLGLVLSGVILSALFSGVANTLLLTDPHVRAELLNWLAGNINHVYADRLYHLWWLGAGSTLVLLFLARALTLVSLGRDTAASAGVAILPVTYLGLAAVVVGASSAVAICGPVGFIGLVVPHMVRPFTGNLLSRQLPVCAVVGAGVCLWADVAARLVFKPYVLHTGVMMDLLGGVVFVWIVRRHYFQSRNSERAG